MKKLDFSKKKLDQIRAAMLYKAIDDGEYYD